MKVKTFRITALFLSLSYLLLLLLNVEKITKWFYKVESTTIVYTMSAWLTAFFIGAAIAIVIFFIYKPYTYSTLTKKTLAILVAIHLTFVVIIPTAVTLSPERTEITTTEITNYSSTGKIESVHKFEDAEKVQVELSVYKPLKSAHADLHLYYTVIFHDGYEYTDIATFDALWWYTFAEIDSNLSQKEIPKEVIAWDCFNLSLSERKYISNSGSSGIYVYEHEARQILNMPE